jgi:hypothetical protein
MLTIQTPHSIRSKEVLEDLHRCDGQITDFGRPVGQILFDPAPGNTRAERIEWETFSLLRDAGWIVTEDKGGIQRYRISEAGFAHVFTNIAAAESQGSYAGNTSSVTVFGAVNQTQSMGAHL